MKTPTSFLRGIPALCFLLVSGCGKHAPVPHYENGSLVIPPRDPQFEEVTAEFGPLTIYEGDFKYEGPRAAWSAPWFPARDTFLFETRGDQKSPLERFDIYSKLTQGKRSSAADYEREHVYSWGSDSWEGHCDAWAAASLLEAEPKNDLTVRSIHFRIADLKALLIKSYENLEGIRKFGQRFEGTRKFHEFDDIYPDQFHRFFDVEMGIHGRSFVMDNDLNRQVWNYPVWKITGKARLDPNEPRIMHVQTWIHSSRPIQPGGDYSHVGILPTSFAYTYDLYGDPIAGGGLKVTYGVWTGRSLDDHPDFVTQLPSGPSYRHWSQNVELNTELVKDLLSRLRQ